MRRELEGFRKDLKLGQKPERKIRDKVKAKKDRCDVEYSLTTNKRTKCKTTD